MVEKRSGDDSGSVRHIIDSANIHILVIYFGSWKMVSARSVETISRVNNVRSVLRMSFDRLYIAHTRRIMATASTIIVCLCQEWVTQQLTIGSDKKESVRPFTDVEYCFTF